MGGWTGADGRSLAILFGAGTSCGLSDAELLEQFLAGPNEQAELAFESLLLRHGPMVLAVCQRIVGSRHDAEDAFQATFLILATRARSIRKHRSLANWLHGVALKVSRRARARALRTTGRSCGDLPRRQGMMAILPRPQFRTTVSTRRHFIRRCSLPRKYREAIVLCSLQGMTQEAAAGMLRCPASTIGVRLMRARMRLKTRLNRRAMAESGGERIHDLLSGFALPVLPAGLVSSTVRVAAPHGTKGVLSIGAAGLASEVLRSMLVLNRVKIAMLGLDGDRRA